VIKPRIPRIKRHPNIIWEFPIPKMPTAKGGASSKYDMEEAFRRFDVAICQIFEVQKHGNGSVWSCKVVPGGAGEPRKLRTYLWAGDKSITRLNALEKQSEGSCHFSHFPAGGVKSYEG